MKSPRKKLYRVQVGHVTTNSNVPDDIVNFNAKTVIATTAEKALKRVRLRKGSDFYQYHSAVSIISEIDIS